MSKIRVGVAGYGTIGQRLADGVAQQEDMERTRDLYRVSWRNPSLPSEPESPPTQQQIDPGSENNE